VRRRSSYLARRGGGLLLLCKRSAAAIHSQEAPPTFATTWWPCGVGRTQPGKKTLFTFSPPEKTTCSLRPAVTRRVITPGGVAVRHFALRRLRGVSYRACPLLATDMPVNCLLATAGVLVGSATAGLLGVGRCGLPAGNIALALYAGSGGVQADSGSAVKREGGRWAHASQRRACLRDSGGGAWLKAKSLPWTAPAGVFAQNLFGVLPAAFVAALRCTAS